MLDGSWVHHRVEVTTVSIGTGVALGRETIFTFNGLQTCITEAIAIGIDVPSKDGTLLDFIDVAITVVIDVVAHFNRIWVDRGIIIVAVAICGGEAITVRICWFIRRSSSVIGATVVGASRSTSAVGSAAGSSTGGTATHAAIWVSPVHIGCRGIPFSLR